MAKEGKTAVVPKLRFPEFREAEDWGLKRGDHLFDAINNRAPSEILPILAITQEYGAIPRDQIDYHVSVTEQSIESYKSVEKGDFIISLRSFQGGIEYSSYRGICSPAYVILRRKCRGSDGYFRHLFKSARFIQQLTRNIEGLRDGKMISYRQFSEQLIPTPIPAEQQKIADCLTSLDEVIAAQGRKVEALKTYKRGLMQQLFPRESKTLPRLRFPEFRNAPEWKSEKLDTLAKRGSGHTPSKSITGYYNGEVKWISLADSRRLDRGLISQTAIEISQQGLENSSAVLHPTGSVVLSRDAGVGKSAVMGMPMAVSQHFIVWTCHGKRMSNWFLYYVLQKMKPVFECIATGSTIKTIGVPFFRDMTVMVPSLSEQQRIAELLSSFDAQVAAEEDKLAVLKAHKRGLMQQLFLASEE